MVTSILEHERIETTLPKAKELRRLTDRMITLAKRGDLHAKRQALGIIRKKEVVQKLFSEIVINFEDRNGGYTRILKLGPRPGDNAPMAIIELVVMTSAKKKQESAPAKGKKSGVDKAKARMGKAKAPKKETAKKEAAEKETPEQEKKKSPKKKASAPKKPKDKAAKGEESEKGAGKEVPEADQGDKK
jgi:large subunit ribosomal protein L17